MSLIQAPHKDVIGWQEHWGIGKSGHKKHGWEKYQDVEARVGG